MSERELEDDVRVSVPVTAVLVEHNFPGEGCFKPGVYRHYKGGFYYAMTIGYVNEIEPRERAVFYLSMTTGEWHARPYEHETKDAWCDQVLIEAVIPEGEPSVPAQWWQRRFVYVGPQPIPKTHG